mmetsp:Transcript_8173/g.16630  ORF Transcript_8173/g.16630 Transcript_8173/m.16630 type:complete len:474 (-) Transcript_8173:205-1626(-)
MKILPVQHAAVVASLVLVCVEARAYPDHSHLRGQAYTGGNTNKRLLKKKTQAWDDTALKQRLGIGGGTATTAAHNVPLGDNGLPKCYPNCYEQIQTSLMQNALDETRANLGGAGNGVVDRTGLAGSGKVVEQIDEDDVETEDKTLHFNVYLVSNGDSNKIVEEGPEERPLPDYVLEEISTLNQELEDANGDGIVHDNVGTYSDWNRLPYDETPGFGPDAPMPDIVEELNVINQPFEDVVQDIDYNRVPGDADADVDNGDESGHGPDAPAPDTTAELDTTNQPFEDVDGEEDATEPQEPALINIDEDPNRVGPLPNDNDRMSDASAEVEPCSVPTWPIGGNGVGYECVHDYHCQRGCCAVTNELLGNRRCVAPGAFHYQCQGDLGDYGCGKGADVNRLGDGDDSQGALEDGGGAVGIACASPKITSIGQSTDTRRCNKGCDCVSGKCAYNPPKISQGICVDTVLDDWDLVDGGD